jgi:hypothetical protein
MKWDYYLGDTLLYVFATNEALWKTIKTDWLYNDFAKKSQIILKMRTADVCHTCMRKFIERDIRNSLPVNFFDILDGIRLSMTFRSRSAVLKPTEQNGNQGTYEKIFLTA